ncbi:MAG: helix-turn-helix transcriptional regulator [Rhodomicrobium sp.]|nr:helix-turn-helix transcriptional regulator [Rhodomicrobium sp.]
MQTRIREFRKLRGMTLKELAEKISTTPQTVQRLETANMTVSTDWLEKIARALLVEPADLLGARSSREIQLIGRIGEQGRVSRVQEGQTPVIHLEVPADNPVAARLDAKIGYFDAGSVLIANRFREEDIENAHGVDCLVAVADGPILLRRMVRGRNKGWTLVPHESGCEIQYDQAILWAARIIMSVKYF